MVLDVGKAKVVQMKAKVVIRTVCAMVLVDEFDSVRDSGVKGSGVETLGHNVMRVAWLALCEYAGYRDDEQG